MKDHEIAQKVNDLTGVARCFRDAQQLRERIAYLIVDELKELQRLRAENETLRKSNSNLQEVIHPMQQACAELRAKNRTLTRELADSQSMLDHARKSLQGRK